MTSIKVLAILLAVLYIAVLVQKNYPKSSQRLKENVIIPAVSPTLTPSPALIPTTMPTVLPTSIPAPKTSYTNINSFIYPNSSRISYAENSAVLQSSDNTQVITNWYKDKIISLGMNVKSFVQTNTNGNILNKLIGANGSINVSIEISKQNSDSKTLIKISVK